MKWFVQCYKIKSLGKLNLDLIVALGRLLVHAESGSCVCAVLPTCLDLTIQMKVNAVL